MEDDLDAKTGSPRVKDIDTPEIMGVVTEVAKTPPIASIASAVAGLITEFY